MRLGPLTMVDRDVGRVARGLDPLQARQQLAEDRPHLQAARVRAQAEVAAEAEAHVTVDVGACDVERERVVKTRSSRFADGYESRSQSPRAMVVSPSWLSSWAERMKCFTGLTQRTISSHAFVDERWVGLEARELLGVLDQGLHASGDRTRRGVVPGGRDDQVVA